MMQNTNPQTSISTIASSASEFDQKQGELPMLDLLGRMRSAHVPREEWGLSQSNVWESQHAALATISQQNAEALASQGVKLELGDPYQSYDERVGRLVVRIVDNDKFLHSLKLLPSKDLDQVTLAYLKTCARGVDQWLHAELGVDRVITDSKAQIAFLREVAGEFRRLGLTEEAARLERRLLATDKGYLSELLLAEDHGLLAGPLDAGIERCRGPYYYFDRHSARLTRSAWEGAVATIDQIAANPAAAELHQHLALRMLACLTYSESRFKAFSVSPELEQELRQLHSELRDDFLARLTPKNRLRLSIRETCQTPLAEFEDFDRCEYSRPKPFAQLLAKAGALAQKPISLALLACGLGVGLKECAAVRNERAAELNAAQGLRELVCREEQLGVTVEYSVPEAAHSSSKGSIRRITATQAGNYTFVAQEVHKGKGYTRVEDLVSISLTAPTLTSLQHPHEFALSNLSFETKSMDRIRVERAACASCEKEIYEIPCAKAEVTKVWYPAAPISEPR